MNNLLPKYVDKVVPKMMCVLMDGTPSLASTPDIVDTTRVTNDRNPTK